ncbi:hypothetical protein BH11PLA2_BH11PLA2_02600 [soil metagenome]
MFSIPRECEFCQSSSLRLSRSSKLRWLARVFFMHPIRCMECNSLIWRLGIFPPKRLQNQADRRKPSSTTTTRH